MNKLEIENENFLKKTKIEFIKEESEYHINVIINKNKCRFSMKMFFFFSLIFYFAIILFKGDSFYNYEIDSDEIIQKSGTKIFLKIEFVNKFNSFIKLCNNITNLNKINNYSSVKNPKISVILPIYNGGRYLKNSLVSIETQNFKEIEIILIDDCSTDNSISIIEEYMKKDLRIRLIKNIKNRKILYSKSIGALNSNGEYIIELDQDDMFIREDAFQILYSEAKTHGLDLVQMRDFFK